MAGDPAQSAPEDVLGASQPVIPPETDTWGISDLGGVAEASGALMRIRGLTIAFDALGVAADAMPSPAAGFRPGKVPRGCSD